MSPETDFLFPSVVARLLPGPDGSQITKDILGIVTTNIPNSFTAHREPWEQGREM
jgi:hypothetical protein